MCTTDLVAGCRPGGAPAATDEMSQETGAGRPGRNRTRARDRTGDKIQHTSSNVRHPEQLQPEDSLPPSQVQGPSAEPGWRVANPAHLHIAGLNPQAGPAWGSWAVGVWWKPQVSWSGQLKLISALRALCEGAVVTAGAASGIPVLKQEG